MISDQVFNDALEVSLKGQGYKAKDRKRILNTYSYVEPDCRDKVLDIEEMKARKYRAEKKVAKKIASEFEEQCAFVHWFKKTYPDVVIISIRNGGSRTPRERVDQLREGLHPGAADLYVPAWHLWIEFKRVKGGVLSEEQEKFANYVMSECNDYWMLAMGCEDGKKQINSFKWKNKT